MVKQETRKLRLYPLVFIKKVVSMHYANIIMPKETRHNDLRGMEEAIHPTPAGMDPTQPPTPLCLSDLGQNLKTRKVTKKTARNTAPPPNG